MRKFILGVFAVAATMLVMIGCGAVPVQTQAPGSSEAPPPVHADRGMHARGLPTAYTMVGGSTPWQIVLAITSNANYCTLTGDDYTIVHLGIRDDGVTASATGDYVVVSRVLDGSGSAAVADCNLGDGVKAPLFPGGNITFPSDYVPAGSGGTHQIAFQASGHGARLLLIRGRK